MKCPIRFLAIIATVFALAWAVPEMMAQSTTAFFAQVAVGSGFTTTFTLLNTGDTLLNGNLILTKSDGTPMNVNLSLSSGSQVTASSVPVPIQPGGSLFVTATAANPGDSFTGWARVESSGGTLGGVATFEYLPSGELQTIAGVLSADVTPVATIPVDDNVGTQQCVSCTGYAVANPGSSPISIRVVEVSADGTTVTPLDPINLDPGKHTAAFFFQDNAAARNFQGSAVLIGQGGATFSVVALVQVQSTTGPLYTAIPVIPAKAPKIN
ncbi:MAG TPA: hypothetical protein VE398_02815 [Acidobacteriota bacterium]|nr:hypothetical protein [Acidobacteriota bacterium]